MIMKGNTNRVLKEIDFNLLLFELFKIIDLKGGNKKRTYSWECGLWSKKKPVNSDSI